MKPLIEYILKEEDAGAATPANTMGEGNPTLDELVVPITSGIPKGETYIIRRRKHKRKDKRDYPMKGKVHNA